MVHTRDLLRTHVGTAGYHVIAPTFGPVLTDAACQTYVVALSCRREWGA